MTVTEPSPLAAIKNEKVADKRWRERQERMAMLLALFAEGWTVERACERVGIARRTYEKYREVDHTFRARVDSIRQGVMGESNDDGDHGSFFTKWFGLPPAFFHRVMLDQMDACPRGHIRMFLLPPDHAKTTTFENYSSEKLALDPRFRFMVASENRDIAKKIVGRVRNRFELGGPYPDFVRQFGPFAPQAGMRHVAHPWNDIYFNVYKKGDHDERDYNMVALGRGSTIVSARTDHLHCDDLQSTKTADQTPQILEWLRQDAFTRPGTKGKTTIAGTRVREDDIYNALDEDEELNGIMEVTKFPAIITDQETGEQTPLWPDMFTLDELDVARRKVGSDAWDRNFMQNPGASRRGKGAFNDETIESCLRPEHSLEHLPNKDRIVYVGVDPALGGQNCVLAAEVLPTGGLLIRRIREEIGFQRNEQIIGALGSVIDWCNRTARVTDVVIEDKNFQKGLKNDERLHETCTAAGISVGGHLTGWNKYDENIGVASMAESFMRQEIILPWAEDSLTRFEIGELVRQLKAWKPHVKGTKLRQDRVMALWFIWILWRTRFKMSDPAAFDGTGWKRDNDIGRAVGLHTVTRHASGLILPVGYRP